MGSPNIRECVYTASVCDAVGVSVVLGNLLSAMVSLCDRLATTQEGSQGGKGEGCCRGRTQETGGTEGACVHACVRVTAHSCDSSPFCVLSYCSREVCQGGWVGAILVAQQQGLEGCHVSLSVAFGNVFI